MRRVTRNTNPEKITVFQIGKEKRQIAVNKQTLIDQSSVFERMFSGQFAIPPLIIISDIEADVFQLMINCFSGTAIKIKRCDVFKLMYAAEKYMFDPLMKLCETFIVDLLNQNDGYVFDMLEASQPFTCDAVKAKCWEIILENPIKCFQSVEFLEIQEDTLKMILRQPKMNCTLSTLLRVTKRWLKSNGFVVETMNDVTKIIKEQFGIDESELKAKQFHNIWSFNDEQTNVEKFRTKTENIMLRMLDFEGKWKRPRLHGLVLCIGVYPELETTTVDDDYRSDVITIKISVKGDDAPLKKIVRVVPQPQSMMTTIKVVFEKTNIETNIDFTNGDYVYDESDEDDDPRGYSESMTLKLQIEVDFGTEKFRSVIRKHKYIMPGKYGYCVNNERCKIHTSVVSALLLSGRRSERYGGDFE